jgi:hypothetical protein
MRLHCVKNEVLGHATTPNGRSDEERTDLTVKPRRRITSKIHDVMVLDLEWTPSPGPSPSTNLHRASTTTSAVTYSSWRNDTADRRIVNASSRQI